MPPLKPHRSTSCTTKFCAIVIVSIIFLNCSVDANGPATASLVVPSFEARDSRALEVFRKLAEQQHIVIAVSGTLVGSDHTLISVNLSNTTIGNVMDTITSADSRYTWREESDGTIMVVIGQHPLDLLNISVRTWTLSYPVRYELSSKIAEIPEVHKWLIGRSCDMSEFFAGAPPSQVLDIVLTVSNEDLQSILSKIAMETRTYFWSAIRYSESPCAINLRP